MSDTSVSGQWTVDSKGPDVQADVGLRFCPHMPQRHVVTWRDPFLSQTETACDYKTKHV